MKPKKHHEEVEMGELNLVPYLDIMVNLIMFMLLSMSGLIEMKVINVSVPAISSTPDVTPPDKPDKEALAVVLGIIHTSKGFIVSVNGKFMDGTTDITPTVPAGPDGKYNFPALQKKMEAVKVQQTDLTVLTIVPDRKVDYATLVKTMDTIRYDSNSKILFPDVLLGVQ